MLLYSMKYITKKTGLYFSKLKPLIIKMFPEKGDQKIITLTKDELLYFIENYKNPFKKRETTKSWMDIYNYYSLDDFLVEVGISKVSKDSGAYKQNKYYKRAKKLIDNGVKRDNTKIVRLVKYYLKKVRQEMSTCGIRKNAPQMQKNFYKNGYVVRIIHNNNYEQIIYLDKNMDIIKKEVKFLKKSTKKQEEFLDNKITYSNSMNFGIRKKYNWGKYVNNS